MLRCVFVYLVDVAEIAVVGVGKRWRYEQECVSLAAQHVVGDVVAGLGECQAEVVY